MKQNIWIDTDMGNDDIVAISLLTMSRSLNIQGVSTVFGVSRPSIGLQNLNRICTFMGVPIPLYEGSDKALTPSNRSFPLNDIERAEKLTLLTNLSISKVRPKRNRKLLEPDLINFKQNTTIVALGPLTNIATILTCCGQDEVNKIKEIVLMGGGIGKGNVSPDNRAEYNIWLDPVAAQIVFSKGIPITMVGIDATSWVPNSKEFSNKIDQLNPKTKQGKVMREIIMGNRVDFDYFYDPLVATIMINPQIVKNSIVGNINVPIAGIDLGVTQLTNSFTSNVKAVTEIDPDAFYSLLVSLIPK